MFFRPKPSPEYKKYQEIMEQYIKQQVKNNIHTKAITPLNSTSKERFLKKDFKNLVERHITKNKNFIFPCQVMIFADKVAFISFENPVVTTFIENKTINQTFTQIFNLFWELTETEHQQIINNW